MGAPLLIAFGCTAARYSTEPGAPTLVLPAHFAEGQGEGAASGTPLPVTPPRASASAAGSAAPVVPKFTPSTAPDPTPLKMADQVEYELELSDGKVHVLSVKTVKLSAPIVTPRRVGRYAIELSIGHELIERVRFDFPGTAADEPEAGPKKRLYAPLTLSARAIAHVRLQLPHSPRVRQALLVDRGLNTATELQWPLPEVAKGPPATPASGAVPTAAPPAPSSYAPQP